MTYRSCGERMTFRRRKEARSSRVGRRAVLAGCVAALFLTEAARAATFFVDGSDGAASDANAGSETSPWRTIQHAADVAAAGDTIVVKPAVYSERVSIVRSGASGNPILFVSEIPHAAQTQGFEIDASNIRVEGFLVRNASDIGIHTLGNNLEIVNNRLEEFFGLGIGAWNTSKNLDANFTNVLIKDNYIYRCSFGIVATGTGWLIEGNEVERLMWSGNGDSDYSRFFGQDHTFRRNFFHGTGLSDICPPELNSFDTNQCAHVDAFQSFNNNGETAINILFEENWVQDYHQGVFIADNLDDQSVRDITVRNNVFSLGKGLEGVNKSARYRELVGLDIRNNFVEGTGAGWDVRNGAAGTFTKNLQYDMVRSYISENTNITSTDNITWPSNFDDRNDLNVDPGLVNPGDYLGPDGRPFTADDGWIPAPEYASYGPQISLDGVSSGPIVGDDAFTVEEDSSGNSLDVLANDSGTDLTIVSVGSKSAGGTTSINGGTSILYSPAPDYFGAETFSYTARDSAGSSRTGTVTITVNPVNDAPTATNDTFSGIEGDSTGNVLDVLANDSTAPDTGESLTISDISVTSDGGSVTVDGGTRLLYTPATGFSGTETFSYTVNDGNGGSNSATVSVEVLAPSSDIDPNSPPTAENDGFSVERDSTDNVFDVLSNDSDPDSSDSLTIVDLSVTDSGGTVSVAGGSALLYAPAASFTGTETFTYTIEDDHGARDTALVTVTVEDSNSSPVANDDSAIVERDSSSNEIDVLANDRDPDSSDNLTITSVGTPNKGGSVSLGTASRATVPAIVYTPPAGFEGVESFTYTVADSAGATSTAQVNISVEDFTPEATDDTFKVRGNSQDNRMDVTKNDKPKGNSKKLTLDGTDSGTRAANHTIEVFEDHILYTPAVGFTGTDTFTYRVRDEDGRVASAKVTVEVTDEFGLSFCDDYPAILVEIEEFRADFGIGTDDLDEDGIPDDYMLEAMQLISCYEGAGPIGVALDTAYKVNLMLFDDEPNFAGLEKYREAVAAMMAMSTSMKGALNDTLSSAEIPIDAFYETVWCDSEGVCMPQPIDGTPLSEGFLIFEETRDSLTQPFSAAGDPDGDALSNSAELEAVVNEGGGSTEFAIAATDPALDGVVASGGGGGGGCFIATAAFGTPLAGEIDTLRSARDEVLLPGALGAMFVDAYYKISPPIAATVAEHPQAADAVRTILGPAIKTTELLRTGRLGNLLLLVLGIAVTVVAARRLQRMTRI